MIEILKLKDKNKIILVKLGVFYVGIGNDAVLLHKILGFKCTCYKNNVCKVGMPVSMIEKYIEKINKTNYAYVIYNYDKEKIELIEIARKDGKAKDEENENINCLLCKGIKKYEDDNYMKAVEKLIGSEKNE